MLAFAMPAQFTATQMAAIAALANLELDPSETETFARQLGDIIDYAAQVQQVDTAGVPPTASVLSRHPSDRADEVRPSLERDEVMSNAPDASRDAGLFKVPRVIG
jgi:aspartyl-tRNA(Asn)/glutamyl-tRNA(Gln) amidotransferase subunit C